MKVLKRYIQPLMATLLLMGPILTGCSAVSEEGFIPSDQGRLYINDLPASSVSAAAGATETVSIVSNVAWTATVDQTWVAIAIEGEDSTDAQSVEGRGHQELTLTFDANTTASERKVNLTITPTDIAEGVKAVTTVITQNSPNFAVTPLDFTGIEANNPVKQTITIVANNSWSVSPRSNWIHASMTGGTATEGEEITVELTFDNNYTNAERIGEVLVECGQQSAIVTVSQLKGSFTVSRDNLQFDQPGGIQTLDISCISSWTSVVNDASWVQVTPSMGNGNTTDVTINVAPKTSSTPRSTVINFTSGDTSIPVTVTQEAGILRLSQQAFTLTPTAHDLTVNVQCPGNWSVSQSSGNDWCKVLTNNGQGNGVITIAVTENTTMDREAEITVSFGTIYETIYVYQMRAERPVVSYTDVYAIEKYTVGIEATVQSDLRIIESGFYYVEGDNIDPVTAPLRRTVPCQIVDGKMVSQISDLESAITYVIRAYVKTDLYGEVYGDASRFTTAGLIPDDEQHPTPNSIKK